MTRRRWLAGIVTLLGLSLVPLRWVTTDADAAMRERLIATFRTMTEGDFVILEAGTYYVQFRPGYGSAILRGEAVSDRYLSTPLSRAQRATLRRLGWPEPSPTTGPNYARRWTVRSDADRRAVAECALETLRRVYGWRPGSPLNVRAHIAEPEAKP